MPWLFIRWLLFRFARHTAIFAVALTILLVLFDLLANASEVSLGSGHPLISLVFYALLKFPIIANFILPFAVLIAAMQTFGTLAAQSEILALESSGFPFAKIVLVLVFGAFLLATLQFFVADRVLPDVTERLNEWKADGYSELPSLEASPDTPDWLASENHFIHMAGASLDGREMHAPTVIETDDRGVAIRYWNADKAVFGSRGWVFEKVHGSDLVLESALDDDQMLSPIVLPPGLFSSLAKPVEELRFLQLQVLSWAHTGTQIHPQESYRVWTHARVVQPLGGVLMVLLAAPICLQIQRIGRRNLVSSAVFAMAFLYFILQNVLLALGEKGEISPILAAWGGFLIFGGIGLAVVTFRAK